MNKKDAIISAIVGFFVGIFSVIILQNLLDVQSVFAALGLSKEISPFVLWYLTIIFPLLSLLGMFIVSVLGRKFLIIKQAGKFVLVGALNTFIDLGVLNFLISVSGVATGIHFSFFKSISFLAATINSYFWNKHWTFEKGKEVFSSQEYSKFLGVTAIGFLINVGVASFAVNAIDPQFGVSENMWATIGAVIAALFAWVWNFLSAKFIVFKK